MVNKLLIIACALAFGIGVVTWNTKPPNVLPSAAAAVSDKEVQDFSFVTLSGKPYKFSDFRGKIVFVNSWLTRCPPCVKEMPDFLELARKHPNDMVFIALAVDLDKANVLRYIDQLPEEKRQLIELDNVYFAHDPGMKTSRNMLGFRGFPETLIADKNGQQLHKVKGVIDWLGPKVEALFSG